MTIAEQSRIAKGYGRGCSLRDRDAHPRSPGQLTVAEEDLCYIAAAQALELFKAHELSPLELMTSLIERDRREVRSG